MVDHPRSAAASLYPNLRQASSEPQQQRQQPRVADALYPNLVPKPKSQNPYLHPMTEQAWRDQLWALAGLRRKT